MNWHNKLSDWLESAAFPLWTGAGMDHATGTVWEALDHAGAPLAHLDRRLRVQSRQAYCFARSPNPRDHALALHLFRFVMDRGFDPETGQLASWLSPDGRILKAPHDLYDLTFALLAAAALIKQGVDLSADMPRLQEALARLKAPSGWHEAITATPIRRQNPHMHLFEAATALFEATGDPAHRDIADECLGLFQDHFVDSHGVVREYYTEDWRPLAPQEQEIQPGHVAEWIYLLNRYESVTGDASGVDLEGMFEGVLAQRDAAGFLPDCTAPSVTTRRLWPQTELLKASITMQRRGCAMPAQQYPEQVIQLIWKDYLCTDMVGGWYDKRSHAGALLSNQMPASSFYHIVEAVQYYLSGN